MAGSRMLGGRYKIEEPPIGQGGMGVVYRAFDNVLRKYVAVKTVKGAIDPSCLALFEKEWTVLARLCHPNIVDILDLGELTENDQAKPYFVMPLLPGVTLDKLIKTAGPQLTPERTIEIIAQACRGLQAAHDQGLVHRDLKPTNLFVMEDDTVKIIDFGVVHLADHESRTGVKGTLQYMAPEQLDLKPATARSDIFSLGVVCYEALTGRKPFDGKTGDEVVEAIRTRIPPSPTELNPAINEQVSRAVHRALAKQPYHRFASAREFADVLQRSVRNEYIEQFDPGKIRPRINRVKKALTEGDFQFAQELLSELEAEGNLDTELSMLRWQAEQGLRGRTIHQLLEGARTRLEEEEYPLAMQKVQSVLDLEPDNINALALKTEIEQRRNKSQVDRWYQIARQHLDNKLFSKARQAAEEALKLDPLHQPARDVLAEISRAEQEITKVRQEKQQLYEAALRAYRNGEISSALSRLERVVEMGRLAPGHPQTEAGYMAFYDQVRSERDQLQKSYAEGKKALESRQFDRALEICRDILSRRSNEPLFQSLKIEVEDRQRQESSAAIAEYHSRAEAEPNLDRKLAILKEAAQRFPNEQTFPSALKLVKERRDLVNTIVARARTYESQGQYLEAANQWDVLRNIYAQYPGLDHELRRLSRRQEEHVQDEAKSVWVERIDQALGQGEYQQAQEFIAEALKEFPNDGELIRLQEQVAQTAQRSREAQQLLQQGQELTKAGHLPDAVEALRHAFELENRNPQIRTKLGAVLLEYARQSGAQDWRAALPLVEEALELNPGDPEAANVSAWLEDVRKRERIDRCLMEGRELQTAGKLPEALERVEQALREFPNEIRLLQLQNTLRGEDQKAREPIAERARSVAAATSGAASSSGYSDPPSTSDAMRYLGTAKNQPVSRVSAPAASDTGIGATRFFSGQNAARLVQNESRSNNLFTAESSAAQPNESPVMPEWPGLRQGILNDEPASGGELWKKLTVAAALLILIGGGAWWYFGKPAETDQPKQNATGTAPSEQRNQVASPTPTSAPSATSGITGVDQPVIPPPKVVKTEQAQSAAPATTRIQFESSPPGAQVTVDNSDFLGCPTPCDFWLASGSHTITFSAPDRLPQQRTIQVPSNTHVYAYLEENARSMLISSEPPGGELTIDGEPQGETPKTVRLKIGSHKVRVAKGDLKYEGDMKVSSDSQSFTVTLGQ